jgi:signal transduction histidine kinase
MLWSSRDYKKDTPAYEGGYKTLSDVQATVDGQTRGATLPMNFTGLSGRTEVTLSAVVTVSEGDCVYLKSVYAPLKVYANGNLIYQCGQEGSYPEYMQDPPTTTVIVPFTGLSGQVELRLEYLSPMSRDTLSVQPPLIGQEAALTRTLLQSMGFSLAFSIIQIVCGILLILASIVILFFERKGISFLWLGLFSLFTGLWAFGECNFSGFLVADSTALYLLDFAGLFLLPVPLFLFGLSIIDFHDRRLPCVLTGVNLAAVCAAFILQFSGRVQLSTSMYAFHLLLPLLLFCYAACVMYEEIHYKSRAARRIFFPMAILAVFALLEVLNYRVRVTNVLTLPFQIGVVVFILLLGVTGGLYVRDAITMRSEKQRLEFEVKLMEHSINGQKQHQQLLLDNAAAIREQRHDLRHQLAVIRTFNKNGESEQLADYLDELIAQIPNEPEGNYCENIAVNAVVSYYAVRAEKSGIDLSVHLTIPAELEQITDSSLCVIFGNLLENGVEACERMTDGHKFIRLRSRLQYETLTVSMDNSFDGIVKRENGALRSSKRPESGIGTASVTAMAEQHGGSARFEANGGVFQSSVYVRV